MRVGLQNFNENRRKILKKETFLDQEFIKFQKEFQIITIQTCIPNKKLIKLENGINQFHQWYLMDEIFE